MRRKIAPLLSAVACCALLASCGGGDSSPTPTPTPSPSPSPSPTPTPTPTPVLVDFDFTKAFTATNTNTSYAYAYFAPTGGAETWSDGNIRNGTSKITYAVSPESAAFLWRDTTPLTVFGAADLKTATAQLRSYSKGDDGLVMELPFQNVLRVTYETKVAHIIDAVAGTLHSYRAALFFNTVSTTSAITSNLSYTGTAQVAGGKMGTTPPGAISSPQTTLTVAASDKKITGTITIRENVNGTPTVRAVLPISATVGSSSTFSGSTEDTANAFKGNFVGSLAGPSREEVLLLFSVSHTDGRKFVGSFIGG